MIDIRFILAYCLVAGSLLATAFPTAARAEGPFDEAVEIAQQRAVKIYGGRIGRI